jgi:hypothetical protein
MGDRSMMQVAARLAESYPALPDVAAFARRHRREFVLDVFAPDPDAAPAYGEYDHGRDGVTEALIKQGVWEAQESTVAVDILATTPGKVLDFGAHIGWYTVLAGLFGNHPVIAFEPDAPTIQLLDTNARRYGVDVEHRFSPVGPTSPPVAVGGDVALMKCDIEGMDGYAVDACAGLFRRHRIRYALIEVSPIFTADGRSDCDYVVMVGQLRDWGYRVYRVPPKGWEHNDAYREQPLATLKAHRELGTDWAEVVAGCRQDNFVFIRNEDA